MTLNSSTSWCMGLGRHAILATSYLRQLLLKLGRFTLVLLQGQLRLLFELTHLCQLCFCLLRSCKGSLMQAVTRKCAHCVRVGRFTSLRVSFYDT